MADQRIRSFLEVYETGSFTKAADSLALTQPAVSKHVKSLEDEFGVDLFIRSHNKLYATPEGNITAKYARKMLQLEHNMKKELNNSKRQLSRISVGITHTAESNASAEALASFAMAHAKMKVKIISDTTDKLLGMLKDYRLDLAVIEGRISDPGLKSVVLDTDCLVLAVPPEHPMADKPYITIDELKQERLIIRSRHSGTRNMFVSSLEARNMHLDEFTILMELDNIATIKDLIRRGFGVSVLPRSTCEDEWKKGKINLLPIEGLGMIREMNLVYRKDWDRPAILSEIAEFYNKHRN